jgi:hypothetical protein
MLQGEDFIMEATVRDSADTLVDLTEAAITQVKAHLFIGFKQMQVYALVSESGFLPLTLSGTNKVVLPITRQQSANFDTGTLAVVVAVTRTDGQFPNGKVTKYTVKNLGEVLQDNSIPIV